MIVIRAIRILLFAGALVFVFNLSRQVSELRGNEPVPGLEWSLGALSVVFLVRAAVTEYWRGPEANLMKDLLWGLGGGGIAAILTN